MNAQDLTLTPQTAPIEIYRYRDGLYAADMLAAAITGLDFFTFLADQPRTKDEICKSLGTQQRPTDVMLTLLTAMGLLDNKGGNFSLTLTAREHLVSTSSWHLGPYYASVKDRPVAKDILNVLRTGKPSNWASLRSEQEWSRAMEREDFAAQFTASMDCRGVYLGQALAKKLDLSRHSRLLDIAGGSGIYACSLVAHNPHLTATVLEKKPVDTISSNAIARRGFANRVSVIAADMFRQPLPGDYDLHLFSNVLHDWDEPLVKELLAKSFAALPSGGMILIHDMHINADKTGPLPVAAYSAMLATLTEGQCYSTAEMTSLLTDAGFHDIGFMLTAADRSVITALK